MDTQASRTAIAVDWDDVFDGHFPASPARQAWRHAVAAVAEKAKATLPACMGRIDAAVTLVLAGDVELLANGTARVASQREGQTVYHVINGDCTCPDFPRAPERFCKHRLAYGIAKRATQRLQATRDEQSQASTSPPAPTWVEQAKQHPPLTAQPESPGIPPQFLTQIHGKDFVQYAGLLAMAHERGLVTLSAHFMSVTSDLAVAEATAEFRDGKTFMECADATPANVHARIKPHFPRMALTRAKARALRDALNIHLVAVEELDA